MKGGTEFKYCPNCGNSSLTWDGEKRWSCTQCQFTLYHNCAAAVAVLIRCEDEILVTKRNLEPGKGLLDLPGGFVDPNESAEEACSREVREELKIELDLNSLKILKSRPNEYPYKGILYHTLDLFVEYRVKEKPLFAIDRGEIHSVEWMNLHQLDLTKWAFESQKEFLSTYI
ncbi:NUDIX hydrolase [Chryseobacterium sp. A321]